MSNFNNIQKEIDETRYLLKENTNLIVERDNKLDDIEHKSAALALGSNQFKRKTRVIRNKYWLESKCVCIIFIFCIILVLILIFISINHKKKIDKIV